MIAFDASIVIDAIRETRKGRSGPVTRRLEELGKELVALPVFVLCELEIGASRDDGRLVRAPASGIRLLPAFEAPVDRRLDLAFAGRGASS